MRALRFPIGPSLIRDVPLRLSVTKWIHLNEGDEGIRRFFQRVHSVLRPAGVFILEPQEWETYAKARRLDPVGTSMLLRSFSIILISNIENRN